MTTWYSQSSGNFSTPGLWNTARDGSGSGGAPVDGDAFTIQAGHAIVNDMDLSGLANGITSSVIEGGATPGMLAFKADADGSYAMKFASGATLSGTTAAGNRGRLLLGGGAWGSPAALPFGRKHVLVLAGTTTPAKIDASNLSIQATCCEPTLKGARTYNQINTVVSVNAGTDTITLTSWPGSPAWANDTPVRVTSSGALPTPLEENVTYWLANVNSGAKTLQLKAYSGTMPVIDLTSVGSGTIRIYDGTPSGATVLNVLDDVTGDAAWTTVAGHNAVTVVNEAPAAYDQQRTTITNIAAGAITIGNALTAGKYPGSRIWLSSRNVSIQCSGTAAVAAMVDWGTADFQNPPPINWELRNTAGTGTTTYGSGYFGGGVAGGGKHAWRDHLRGELWNRLQLDRPRQRPHVQRRGDFVCLAHQRRSDGRDGQRLRSRMRLCRSQHAHDATASHVFGKLFDSGMHVDLYRRDFGLPSLGFNLRVPERRRIVGGCRQRDRRHCSECGVRGNQRVGQPCFRRHSRSELPLRNRVGHQGDGNMRGGSVWQSFVGRNSP